MATSSPLFVSTSTSPSLVKASSDLGGERARLAARGERYDCLRGEGLGQQCVFFDRYNVASYALARLKADRFHSYRSNDWWNHVRGWTAERDGDTELAAKINADIEAKLAALFPRRGT